MCQISEIPIRALEHRIFPLLIDYMQKEQGDIEQECAMQLLLCAAPRVQPSRFEAKVSVVMVNWLPCL